MAILTMTSGGWRPVLGQDRSEDSPAPTAPEQNTVSTSRKVGKLAALRAEVKEEIEVNNSSNQRELLLQIYREIVVHPENDGRELVDDLANLLNLYSDHEGPLDDVVEFCELAIQAHPKHWQVRLAIAGNADYWPQGFAGFRDSTGYIIGDQIFRGYDYDSEESLEVSFAAHDRVRHLQLLSEAMELVGNDPVATSKEKADVFETLASVISNNLSYESQNLDQLTDLNRLPDPVVIDEAWELIEPPAPIQLDEKGQPVGFRIPDSWQAARSDRERWHWALEQAAQADPERRSRLELEWIDHLDSMIGISASLPERAEDVNRGPHKTNDESASICGKADIRALPDSDTVVQTAGGLKRVTLDDQHNAFVLLQRIVDRNDDYRVDAMSGLLQLRINRHQLKKAAEQLNHYIAKLNRFIESMPADISVESREDIVRSRGRFVSITDSSDSADTFVVEGQHDARKGFTGEWKIPIDAKLGQYQLKSGIKGSALSQSTSFRVEEYRRPEFTSKLTTTAYNAATDQQQITVDGEWPTSANDSDDFRAADVSKSGTSIESS